MLQQQQGMQRKSSSAMMSQQVESKPRSGYLTKRAIKSGRNWKQRYFILHDNALVYTTDEYSVEKVGQRRNLISLCVLISCVYLPFLPQLCQQPKGTIAITQATAVSKGSDLAPIGNERVFKEVGEENIRSAIWRSPYSFFLPALARVC